jgi:hypothetical protein
MRERWRWRRARNKCSRLSMVASTVRSLALNYHRARWYDPSIGQWLSEDRSAATAMTRLRAAPPASERPQVDGASPLMGGIDGWVRRNQTCPGNRLTNCRSQSSHWFGPASAIGRRSVSGSADRMMVDEPGWMAAKAGCFTQPCEGAWQTKTQRNILAGSLCCRLAFGTD